MGKVYVPSSYVLYQLPNYDYAYVTYRIYKSLILCLNEEYYFKVIKYIPGDSPKQFSNILNTIIAQMSQEFYLKKESRAVQKLVMANKNLTQQLSTLKASYDYKEMMKIKDENAALERAIKKLIKQHDKLEETHKTLIMEFYSLTYTFKQRFSFFLKAFIRLFE